MVIINGKQKHLCFCNEKLGMVDGDCFCYFITYLFIIKSNIPDVDIFHATHV